MKTPNFTPEMEAILRAAAPINKDTAVPLAAQIGRSVRSVIAKATRMEIYTKQGKTTKSGGPVISKEDLVTEIGAIVEGNLEGLEKAPKAALFALRDFAASFAA